MKSLPLIGNDYDSKDILHATSVDGKTAATRQKHKKTQGKVNAIKKCSLCEVFILIHTKIATNRSTIISWGKSTKK